MRTRKWTKLKIIDKLQSLHAEGVPVGKLWCQDSGLASIAAAKFGTWRQALQAAGFESTRQSWSRQRIIDELRLKRGSRQRLDSKLSTAAVRYFGSVRSALAAAGLASQTKPPPYKDWTRAKAIEAIRDRYEAGLSIQATCHEDPSLYAAAKRLFGTWTAARSAAGFPCRQVVNLTANEVTLRIIEMHRLGQSLRNVRERDMTLYRSAKYRFSSWREALRTAGLERELCRRWSKRTVVEAIQRREREGHQLSRTWREDKSLFRAAILWFGNWEPAMVAAGFTPIQRERWTKQRVIERLRVWSERSGSTNLADSDANLACAATRLFGGLDAAFEAANIEPSPRRWTNDRVIAAIQDRYVHGEPRHIQGLGDVRLAYAAKRRFGSWEKAVQAAGLSDKIVIAKPLKRWTGQSVVQAIQGEHGKGTKLSDISKQDQGLYNAAKTHFGSWRGAMQAAGIESSRRAWSKPVIIAEIRRRQRLGESLTSGQPNTINLAAAANRYFGSWTAALAAAGISTKSSSTMRGTCLEKK